MIVQAPPGILRILTIYLPQSGYSGFLAGPSTKYLNLLLSLLLGVGIVRLWLVPLASSFWVDEMGTAFVVHYGPHQRSSVSRRSAIACRRFYSWASLSS
jgi:hypothetical protein